MRKLGTLISRHRHANWALLDQSVVSGSNFVIGILLARFLGPEAFGIFVLLQAVMLYVNSYQGALIFQPMLSAAPQLTENERNKYLQGVFAMQLMLTLFLGLAGTAAAIIAHMLGWINMAGLDANTIAAVICAMFGFQLQDWQRRYFFIREKGRSVFLIDILNYGGQVALLGTAALSGLLDVSTAFWIIASTSFVSFCMGFIFGRVRPVFSHACATLKTGWRTSRDYLVAWQFQWLGSQGVFMVGAGAVGTEAVGGVRATQNIVGPINILFLAMENFIPIAAARKYKENGLGSMTRYLWKITFLGTALLAPVLLMLALFSVPLISFLYGEEYLSFAPLVYWQAVYIFIQFYQRQTFFFLRTIKASGIVLRSGIIMAFFSVGIAWFAVPQYHAMGLMMALLGGVTVSLLYSAFMARKLATRLKESGKKETITYSGNLDANLTAEGKA